MNKKTKHRLKILAYYFKLYLTAFHRAAMIFFCDALKSFISVCLQLSKIYIQELGRELIEIIREIKEYPLSERLSDLFKRKAEELEAWKAERDDNDEV